MSTRRPDPTSIRWRLARLIGPERVALALSVIVIIAIAAATGAGPFGARSSPQSPDPASPNSTGSLTTPAVDLA
jgi:hypothetical protein